MELAVWKKRLLNKTRLRRTSKSLAWVLMSTIEQPTTSGTNFLLSVTCLIGMAGMVGPPLPLTIDVFIWETVKLCRLVQLWFVFWLSMQLIEKTKLIKVSMTNSLALASVSEMKEARKRWLWEKSVMHNKLNILCQLCRTETNWRIAFSPNNSS